METQRDYHALLRGMLSEKRYRHSLAVSARAGELALLHGTDREKAALAGLLHDACKELPGEKQLEIIEKHGIVLEERLFCQKAFLYPNVLHQISAPCFVAAELGIHDPEILSPIRWHATGRPAMTREEMVLYAADLTSEDRDYSDVADYRALANRDLEEMMFQSLRFVVGDLARRQEGVCPDTLFAYNYYWAKKKFGEGLRRESFSW